jgi:hypothetical protein
MTCCALRSPLPNGVPVGQGHSGGSARNNRPRRPRDGGASWFHPGFPRRASRGRSGGAHCADIGATVPTYWRRVRCLERWRVRRQARGGVFAGARTGFQPGDTRPCPRSLEAPSPTTRPGHSLIISRVHRDGRTLAEDDRRRTIEASMTGQDDRKPSAAAVDPRAGPSYASSNESRLSSERRRRGSLPPFGMYTWVKHGEALLPLLQQADVASGSPGGLVLAGGGRNSISHSRPCGVASWSVRRAPGTTRSPIVPPARRPRSDASRRSDCPGVCSATQCIAARSSGVRRDRSFSGSASAMRAWNPEDATRIAEPRPPDAWRTDRRAHGRGPAADAVPGTRRTSRRHGLHGQAAQAGERDDEHLRPGPIPPGEQDEPGGRHGRRRHHADGHARQAERHRHRAPVVRPDPPAEHGVVLALDDLRDAELSRASANRSSRTPAPAARPMPPDRDDQPRAHTRTAAAPRRPRPSRPRGPHAEQECHDQHDDGVPGELGVAQRREPERGRRPSGGPTLPDRNARGMTAIAPPTAGSRAHGSRRRP